MSLGERATLRVPSHFGYGAKGAGRVPGEAVRFPVSGVLAPQCARTRLHAEWTSVWHLHFSLTGPRVVAAWHA